MTNNRCIGANQELPFAMNPEQVKKLHAYCQEIEQKAYKRGYNSGWYKGSRGGGKYGVNRVLSGSAHPNYKPLQQRLRD